MFQNEPLLDFSLADSRTEFQQALSAVDTAIGEDRFTACPIVDGAERQSDRIEHSVDPSDPEIRVGTVHYAGITQAEQAIATLFRGQTEWQRAGFDHRASVIQLAADLMRKDRNNLAALIVREAGKPWKEADADVAEAIDFCVYYAQHARRLGARTKTDDILGEENFYFYRPRGVAAVIAPWNFPLAIPCGMTVAALVCGNATVLKPAEQTSLIAARLARILLEAGVPGDAFAFLPGLGEEIGAAMVEHPLVDLICFTGSRDVGLSIISEAAEIRPGQRNVKKVIAEMGGKNAIIVDEDADLDEAIKGILYSAFAFSGQKCSACSRVIVVGDAYEPFLARFVEAAGDLIVGSAASPSTFVGPVIDGVAQSRILESIGRASKESAVAFKGIAPGRGYFVPPVIFRDVSRESFVWKNELFAPVVACCAAGSFTEALELANDSEYALTGGLFSRSPENIQRTCEEFEVGNLYINRSCTGALVGRQPFGGFGMSGVGSKAGGPDYLLQFVEPRTVTENTMRRGFSPELVS